MGTTHLRPIRCTCRQHLPRPPAGATASCPDAWPVGLPPATATWPADPARESAAASLACRVGLLTCPAAARSRRPSQ